MHMACIRYQHTALLSVFDSSQYLIAPSLPLGANRREKKGLESPRDKNEGACRGGVRGEEPALVTPDLSYV